MHTCRTLYRLAHGQSPDGNTHVHAQTHAGSETGMKIGTTAFTAHQVCCKMFTNTSLMCPYRLFWNSPLTFLTRVSSMLANNCWGSLGISPTHLQVPNGYIIWKEFIVIIW